jgi:hypothetical protein
MQLIKKLALYLLFIPLFLKAEITRYTVSWDPQFCLQPTCHSLVSSGLSQLSQVALVKFDPNAGSAVLFWKPYNEFSYDAIENVMRRLQLSPSVAVGVSYGKQLNGVIKLRGTISREGNAYTIRSIGDNSRFILIGDLLPAKNPHQYVDMFNVDNRPLSPKITALLMEAQKNFRVVTIEGPLLMPERRPPLYIVVTTAIIND